jgi:hypothetical protein
MKITELSEEAKKTLDYIFENGKKDMIYRLKDERAKREYKKGHGNYVFIAACEVGSPGKLVTEYCKEKGYVGSRVDIVIPGEKKEKEPKVKIVKEKKIKPKHVEKEIPRVLITQEESTQKNGNFSICTNIAFQNIGNGLIMADIELFEKENIKILFTENSLNL